MCVQKIKVRNPYYCNSGYDYFEGSLIKLDPKFVSHKEFIEVPCGHCADCRSSYVLQLVQRCQMEAKSSYVYFVTLTYRDSDLPYLTFTTSDGQKVDIFYADIRHIQALVKRMRNLPEFKLRDFRMLYVTEYGSEKFRPHHHLMFFVGKKDTDDDTTPFYFERYLRCNIYLLYGENIGTRKHPVYRKYFDYVRRVINGKVNTTYSCSLVRDFSMEPNDPRAVNSEDSVAAACHYLISYLNKPSRYEQSLTEFIDNMSTVFDSELYSVLRRLLKSRCEYSKHFGWGFDSEGRKVKPSLRHHSYTLDNVYYSTEILTLPDSFDDFCDLNPSLASRIEEIARKFHYRRLSNPDIHTIQEYLSGTDISPLELRICHKYFPKDIESFIFSSHFDQSGLYFQYLPKSDYVDSYKDSLVFKELRKTIDNCPSDIHFIPFVYYQKGKLTYVPLCRYYRRYVCSRDDYEHLYRRAGVSCYDDYVNLFEDRPSLTQKRQRAQQNNEDRHNSNRTHYDEDFMPQGRNIAVILNSQQKIDIFAPTLYTIDTLIDRKN